MKSQEMVVFDADGESIPFVIYDMRGTKWVLAADVQRALQMQNIRDLVGRLRRDGELREGLHFCKFTIQNSGPGNPNVLGLSRRGVIRIAMRSDAPRARAFREWAENVLDKVMETGVYDANGDLAAKAGSNAERTIGFRQGLLFSEIMMRHRMAVDELARFCHLRNQGLTRAELAAVFDIRPHKVRLILLDMEALGIRFQRLKQGRTRMRDMVREFREMLAAAEPPQYEHSLCVLPKAGEEGTNA